MSTQRFGLEDDGLTSGKFATIDRDLIDRLLAYYETHAHDGGATPVPLADPTTAATATQADTGGTLGPGQTLYYRVGFVDQFGLETAASDELAVVIADMPQSTLAPIPTGNTVSGSTLPLDTYYYALTVNSTAGQSPLGPQSVITVYAGQNQVDLALPALPTGATSFNVWRMSVADVGWSQIGTAVTGSTFADTGFPRASCPSDPTTQPPDLLVSAGTNAVTVTVPDATIVAAVPSDVKRWRLYRSISSGLYGTVALVAEVVSDVGVALPTTYVDTGADLLPGTPLDLSTALRPSVAVPGGGGGGGGGGSDVTPSASLRLITDSPTGVTWSYQGQALSVAPVPTSGGYNNSVGWDIGNYGGGQFYASSAGGYQPHASVQVNGMTPGDVVVLQIGTARYASVCPPGQDFVIVGGLDRVWVMLGDGLVSLFGNPVTIEAYWSGGTAPLMTQWSLMVEKLWGPSATEAAFGPTPPAGLTVVSTGSGAVHVSWTAGSPVPDDYGLTAHNADSSYFLARTAYTGTSADLTGLPVGQSVGFDLTTRNVWGVSSVVDHVDFTVA